MNRHTMGAIILVLAIVGASQLIGCRPAPTPTRVPAVSTVSEVTRNGETTVATGRVMPVRSTTLSVAGSGIVSAVLVEEGQSVEAGQVLLRLEAAPLETAVAAAEAALQSKQATLKALQDSPSALDVAAAQATLAEAQANLDMASAGSTDNAQLVKARVAAAKAAVDRARAGLDLVKAGAPPSAIAAAQADVAAAQAALDVAKANLAQSELRAPFAGTVVSLTAHVGEYTDPSRPVVILADLSTWQVETTDVNGLSVTHIHQGDAASISVDALPDLNLTGKVARIGGLGAQQQGDTLYPVVITLDQQDSRLRWNMIATVTIKGQ